MMVGLVLGVIVLFALVTLFVNNSRMRREIDQASQQIENGRYALDLLRDDLHLAGYYGDAVPQTGLHGGNGNDPEHLRHRGGGPPVRRPARRAAMARAGIRHRRGRCGAHLRFVGHRRAEGGHRHPGGAAHEHRAD